MSLDSWYENQNFIWDAVCLGFRGTCLEPRLLGSVLPYAADRVVEGRARLSEDLAYQQSSPGEWQGVILAILHLGKLRHRAVP